MSAGAEGDLSGLSTLLPTCDLKSELINQTGIEALFGRDVQINHANQRGANRGFNKWEAENEGEGLERERLNGLLHAPGHQQEEVVDV